MEKTVYVLGAGFSKESHFPLTGEFTDKKIISKFRKNLNKKEQKRLDKISKYFLDRIDTNYCENNIESVLNHVSVADYLYMESFTESKRSYPSKQIFKDILWYIARFLKEQANYPIPSVYEQFIKHIYKNNDTIISFNYDMVIETVLQKLEINCDYAISAKPIENSVPLMKIHGSVNWTYCTKCKRFVFYPDYAVVKVIENKLKCLRCTLKKLEPIIIPPILYKDTFYKHPIYEKIIRTLWGFASDELSMANKVVFIGFSMSNTDAYAQELFKFSSNMNNNNPSYELITMPKELDELAEIKDRYESVLVGNPIDIKQMPFSKYAKSLLE